MTLALWCLLFAGLLHVGSKAPLLWEQSKLGYDNNNPRDQQASLEGRGKRALAAHQNQIESFPLFAAGVLVATIANVDSTLSGYLALTYIVARIIYIVFYIKDLASLRSTVWLIGFGCSMALLSTPVWAF